MPSFQVEALLKPLSADSPCGENLQYKFYDLETLAQGKEETQFAQGEEPDWRQVRDLSLSYFERGKHLKIAAILALAVLRSDGFVGVRDGLALIRGLLEQYWGEIEPKLDEADNNDPGERINALSMLIVPRGTFGDRFRFLDRVFTAPLCDSRVSGKISLRDIAIASGVIKIPQPEEGAPAKAEDAAGPSRAMIDAAFDETETTKLEEIAAGAEEALAAVVAIENIFRAKCPDQAVSFEDLRTLLKDAGLQVRRRLTARAAAGGEVGAAGGGAEDANGSAPGAGPRAAGLSGEVRTPAEAKAAITKIVAYYERNEPSSPVALVVRAAEKLINIKFEEVYKTLSPDAIELLLAIANKEDSEAKSE